MAAPGGAAVGGQVPGEGGEEGAGAVLVFGGGGEDVGAQLVDAEGGQRLEAGGDRGLVADDGGVGGIGPALPVEHGPVRRLHAVNGERLLC